MKLQFTSKNKDIAAKFAGHIKAERKLESSTVEKEGVYTVEYSVADCCAPMASSEEKSHPTYEDLSSLASYIMREMQYQVNWLSSEISYIFQAMHQHQQGHLPPIKGAEKMEKALTALGIGEDYEVQKPVIYASSRYGTSAEVDFSITK